MRKREGGQRKGELCVNETGRSLYRIVIVRCLGRRACICLATAHPLFTHISMYDVRTYAPTWVYDMSPILPLRLPERI
jgi:hypothetical protein